MMQYEVFNKDGQQIGSVELPEQVFGIEPNEDAMHQTVVAYLANQRQGTRKTKQRADVSGGGKKPWKQKGRGTARAGSSRSPVWVGGATTHGPKPYNYEYKVPKKVSRLARKSAYSVRATERNITIVEDFSLEKFRTKDVASVINNLKLQDQKMLIILPDYSEKMYVSARNIEKVSVAPAAQVSAYDILSHKKILIFKGALENIYNTLAK